MIDLFGRHLELAPLRGRRHGLVRCIFHEDGSPSLSVDLDRGLFHCFGCGLGGGLKRFSYLIGERLNSGSLSALPRDPRAREERAALLQDLLTVGDYIRPRLQAADRARQVACEMGESERTWDFLERAVRVECDALNTEGALDGALAKGRMIP